MAVKVAQDLMCPNYLPPFPPTPAPTLATFHQDLAAVGVLQGVQDNGSAETQLKVSPGGNRASDSPARRNAEVVCAAAPLK